jgi:Regulator of ribonuclease activity B
MKRLRNLFGNGGSTEPPQDSAPVEQNWHAFARDGAHIALITVDGNYWQFEAGKYACTKVTYEFSPDRCIENLLPDSESISECHEIEEAIDASYKSTYLVGTRTGKGLREIWYCDRDALLEAKLRAVYDIFTFCPVTITNGNIKALKQLQPSVLETHLIQNRWIVNTLRENGDDGTQSRQIDLAICFAPGTNVQSLKKALTEAGYYVTSVADDLIEFCRVGCVNLSEMDRETKSLFELSNSHGTRFDGWASNVVCA